MKNGLCIFGEVLFDHFPDGSRVLGGAPFNVAWHLQAFGCSPLFVSRVGDDPQGREIRDTMRHWGMNTAGLQKDSAHPTGEVRVSLQDGQPSFDIQADRAYDYIDAGALPPLTPSLVYQGTLALRQPQSRAALDQMLQQQPAPVFMDVNLRPPWWTREQVVEQLDRARWVKINDAELELLVEGGAELQSKAKTLLQRHRLELVILTQGEAGAFAFDNQGKVAQTRPTEKIPVVDTVGAGDAFASVCILGLLENWALPKIMSRAQQFASLLVGRRGATINDPEAYRPLLAQWQDE